MERMLACDPTLAELAVVRYPGELVLAAKNNRPEVVALLIELGFDVNASDRTAWLHAVAMRGNLDVIRRLLEQGADPRVRDPSFDGTPAGWAEHDRQHDAQEYLLQLEQCPSVELTRWVCFAILGRDGRGDEQRVGRIRGGLEWAVR
jgi:hypothetical protein